MACWLLRSSSCKLQAHPFDTTRASSAARPTTRVIDADTQVEVIGERVRLKGIDAPEKGQWCENASGNLYPCGQAALRALRGHIGDSKAVCGIDPQPDRYGRALGVCYLKGEDLNGWLVSQGHALAYRRYGTQYVEQEEAARAAKRGVWAGAFVAPWEWRAGKRLHVTSATEDLPGADELDVLAMYDGAAPAQCRGGEPPRHCAGAAPSYSLSVHARPGW